MEHGNMLSDGQQPLAHRETKTLSDKMANGLVHLARCVGYILA